MTARHLAARCLCDVLGGGYSNLVFKQRTMSAQLNERDLAFAARLFYGALERATTLEYILSRHTDRKIDKIDREVLSILLTGLYQVLYMDSVPTSAAVSESVKLCTALKKRSAGAFVNAVLRKAASFSMAIVDAMPDTAEGLSIKYSVCPPLAAMLLEQYGSRAAAILAATMLMMPTALRVNTLKTSADALAGELIEQGVETAPGPLPDSLLVLSGRYLQSKAIKEGRARVQSLAAQYAVTALSPFANQSVLDCCAAPGGKALTAAQMMQNKGTIFALDRSEARLAVLTQQASLEGVSIVATQTADAATYSLNRRFDRILCDVPCSGYGEMAAKPELRRKAPDAASGLPELQLTILSHAAAHLADGGRLVYSTCTLDQRENEEVIRQFLEMNPGFVARLPKNIPANAEPVGQCVKFVPQPQNNEGFYIASIERM